MEQLTTEMIMVMAMICVAIFLFIVEWIRVDVVAILMMVSLPLLHLVTPKEAFVGFSSNAVISIIAVIIIGAGLDKTGIINRVVTPVLKIAGNSTSRIVIAISMTVAGISSFMQNIGAAALFLPAIQRVSKRLKIPISQILMPVGFCAILGGTVTLVGSSPLILLNDLLVPFNLTALRPLRCNPHRGRTGSERHRLLRPVRAFRSAQVKNIGTAFSRRGAARPRGFLRRHG